MTTKYTYSIANDFGGSVDIAQLHGEIEADSGITPVLVGVTSRADVVEIIFQSALSAGEETTLNGVVSAHIVDTTPKPRGFYVTSPSSHKFKGTTYQRVLTFHYNPSLQNTIIHIKMYSYQAYQITSYCARIFNKTDNTLIAEVTGLTNKTLEAVDFGTISNVPTGITSVDLELQVKKVGGTKNDTIFVDSLYIYYN